MMKTNMALRLAAGLSLSLAASAFSADYKVDTDHSNVGFDVTHMMVSKVKGNFNKVEGDFKVDSKTGKLTSANGVIDAASINTNNDKRDGHLKSEDFFDVAKFPKITFKMKSYEGTKEAGKLTGDLTIKGVTKSVTLDTTVTAPVKDAWGNLRVGVSATGKINRKDFGLTWNKALDNGGVAVSDNVNLSIDLEGSPAAKK